MKLYVKRNINELADLGYPSGLINYAALRLFLYALREITLRNGYFSMSVNPDKIMEELIQSEKVLVGNFKRAYIDQALDCLNDVDSTIYKCRNFKDYLEIVR